MIGLAAFAADSPDAIPESIRQFLVLDLAPLVAVTLAAGVLALVGSFLVLERRAMLGDAIAHAVLPGLVGAYWITGSRATGPMFIGALVAAALTSVAVGTMTRIGRVEPQAAIGVAFTTMFALGVLLVETTGARNVDLDLDCVLSGQLELLFWNAPRTWSALSEPAVIATLPSPVFVLGGLFVVLAALCVLFWPTLRCVTFDARYAASRGLRASTVRGCLLAATTGVIVASFESLGSILVIALLTCPAAASRLSTRTLGAYVLAATGIGIASGVGGYVFATRVAPVFVGHAVDASGTVATTAGLALAVAAVLHAARARSS